MLILSLPMSGTGAYSMPCRRLLSEFLTSLNEASNLSDLVMSSALEPDFGKGVRVQALGGGFRWRQGRPLGVHEYTIVSP